MMETIFGLLALGLAAVAAALVVARARSEKRLEESTRALMESHREFGNSIERLVSVVVAQDYAAASRRSSGMEFWAHEGARPAYLTITTTRAPFCGRRRRNGAVAAAYRAKSHPRSRYAANDAWEEGEWTVENNGADEYAPSDSWR